MFPSKKEIELLKEEMAKINRAHKDLTRIVFLQQEEIDKLKKPKEPEYFG